MRRLTPLLVVVLGVLCALLATTERRSSVRPPVTAAERGRDHTHSIALGRTPLLPRDATSPARAGGVLVDDAGRGVADALVEHGEHGARTDGRGRWDLPAGSLEDGDVLRIRLPGHAPFEHVWRAADEGPLVVTLAEAFRFVAVDARSGRPLARTRLALVDGLELVTDVHGLARVEQTRRVALRPFPVDARLLDRPSCRTTGVWSVAERAALPHLPFDAGTTIFGSVTDECGRPVAGASVELLGGTRDDGRSGVPRPRDARSVARTEPDGRYRLAGCLPRASARLRASHPRHLGHTSRPFACRAAHVERDLVLTRAGQVAGHVTVNGRPHAGVVLWRAGRRRGSQRTDANGAYELSRVPPGEVAVRLERASEDTETDEDHRVVVEAGRTSHLDLALERTVDRLAGSAHRPDGRPLVGRRVRAWRTDGGRRAFAVTETDLAGRFELALERWDASLHDEPRYSVQVDVDGWGVRRDEVPPEVDDLLLVVRPSGRVALRPPAGGPGFERPLVQWRFADEEDWNELEEDAALVPEPTGVLWVELPHGELELLLEDPLAGIPPTIVPGVDVGDDPEPPPEEPPPPQRGTLTIEFFDASGAPAAPHGLEGFLLLRHEDGSAKRPDDLGTHVRLEHLLPGKWAIELRAGAPTTHFSPGRVYLPPGGSVRERVVWTQESVAGDDDPRPDGEERP